MVTYYIFSNRFSKSGSSIILLPMYSTNLLYDGTKFKNLLFQIYDFTCKVLGRGDIRCSDEINSDCLQSIDAAKIPLVQYA